MEITTGKLKTAQKVVVYGPEGIGKSTFLAQFPGVLFIDTEGSTKHMDVARLPKREARRTTSEVKNISDSGSRGEFIRITEDTIKNVPEVSVFGYTNEQCKLIQGEHRNLLKLAKEKNSSKEVAFVFSKDFSVKAEQIGGSVELSFSGECGKMLSSRSNLFVMHNHPSGKSFSAEDMLFFIKSENVKSFSAVGNNGKVFVLTKNDQHDKLKSLQEYSRLKKKIVKTGSNSEYDKLVEKIIERGGFNYDR